MLASLALVRLHGGYLLGLLLLLLLMLLVAHGSLRWVRLLDLIANRRVRSRHRLDQLSLLFFGC